MSDGCLVEWSCNRPHWLLPCHLDMLTSSLNVNKTQTSPAHMATWRFPSENGLEQDWFLCVSLCFYIIHMDRNWFSHQMFSFFSLFQFRRCSRWRRFAATTDAPVRWTEQAVLTWQHTNGPGKPPDWHSGFAWPAPEVPWSPRGCCLPVCSTGEMISAK